MTEERLGASGAQNKHIFELSTGAPHLPSPIFPTPPLPRMLPSLHQRDKGGIGEEGLGGIREEANLEGPGGIRAEGPGGMGRSNLE